MFLHVLLFCSQCFTFFRLFIFPVNHVYFTYFHGLFKILIFFINVRSFFEKCFFRNYL